VVFLVVCVLSQQPSYPGGMTTGGGMSRSQMASNSTQGSNMSTSGAQTQGDNMTGVPGKGKGKALFGAGKGEKAQFLDSRGSIQKLFTDHLWYTHGYVVASVFQLPTAPALRTRLLQNQDDIGKGLSTAFPKIASHANEITKLLTDHIGAADNVVKAAIAKQDLKQKITLLYQQGEQLADGLSQILVLPRQTLRSAFHNHNEHVIQLTTALLEKKYDVEYIQELDTYKDQMLLIADMIWQAGQKQL